MVYINPLRSMDFIKIGYVLHGALVINKTAKLCSTDVYNLMSITYTHTVKLVQLYADLGFINVVRSGKKNIITLTAKGEVFVNHCYQIINSLLKLKDLWFKDGMNIKLSGECFKFRSTVIGSYNVRLRNGHVIPVSEAVNAGMGYFKKKPKKNDFSHMRLKTRKNLELVKRLVGEYSTLDEARSEFLKITGYRSKESFNYYLKILEVNV